jgi:hypothetical protein
MNYFQVVTEYEFFFRFFWCEREKRENNNIRLFHHQQDGHLQNQRVRHDKRRTDRERERKRDSNEVALVDEQGGSNRQVCFEEGKMSFTGKMVSSTEDKNDNNGALTASWVSIGSVLGV